MTYEQTTARYRIFYAKLLRFYPEPYRERFGKSMEQTFNDLCRERRETGNKIFGFILWSFAETSIGIIKERIRFMNMQNKNIARIAMGTGLILLIPLVLTMFNPNAHFNGGNGGGWDWAPGDFVAMGVLLFATGLALDFAVRKITHPIYRITASIAILTTILLIWVELAVDGVSQILKLLTTS